MIDQTLCEQFNSDACQALQVGKINPNPGYVSGSEKTNLPANGCLVSSREVQCTLATAAEVGGRTA